MRIYRTAIIFTFTLFFHMHLNANGSEIFKAEIGKVKTPYVTSSGIKLPNFNKITVENLKVAFLQSMKQAEAELEGIANNPRNPTFKNTILALENLILLGHEEYTYLYTYNMVLSSEAANALAEVLHASNELSAKQIENKKLFKRVEDVYKRRNQLRLQ